jgi:glycosyltransferase involved in cell wall biosynthesis
MRVVFLTHNYPRHPDDLAGAFLAPLARALQGRGHEVRVIAPSDQGRGGEDLVDGISVTRVRYAAPGRERYAYSGRMQEALASPAGWVALARMLRALRRGARVATADAPNPVVHAHWWFPAGFAAPAEVPAVVTLHGTDARLLDRPLAPWFAGRALGRGRVVTAVSRHVAGQVERATGRRIDPAHTCAMPLVVTGSRSVGGEGLVFVGRLTDQKRVELALQAHARLQASRPGLRMAVVGDGPARPRLERLAAELGAGSLVRWLGQVPAGRVAEILGHADLFLFPARHEGLGLAPVEAVVAGVPVVATRDGGGVLDILDEPGTGAVADPDPAAIAEAAARLLADPGARAAAARAGARWAERLAPDRVAERCEAWYQEAARG